MVKQLIIIRTKQKPSIRKYSTTRLQFQSQSYPKQQKFFLGRFKKKLQALKTSKSTGPNQIHLRIVKELSSELCNFFYLDLLYKARYKLLGGCETSFKSTTKGKKRPI